MKKLVIALALLSATTAFAETDLPGEDFYKALLRIWLGDHPAQDDLKDALPGKMPGN